MKNNVALALIAALGLTACGGKTDANEKNFGAAVGQYLDKKGELCLRGMTFPADVTEFDLQAHKGIPTARTGQLEALAAAGLASAAPMEIDEVGAFDGKPTGRKSKIVRYTLNDAGKKSYRESEVDSIGLDGNRKVRSGELCYGRKALDKVVKWEGPIKLGDYQEANVRYLYKIDQLPEWAKRPDVQVAFPAVGIVVAGAGKDEQRAGVKLTSEGWEPKGLD